ncbi:MAG: hypothetical protein J6A26_04690 [Oscillospiraceae bacterium]|nr:hypothetical protein [Oscillospiraceae bacterium]
MKKLLSLVLVLCMVLSMSVSVFAEGTAVSVSTADELVAALEAGSDVIFTQDIKIDPANMSNAYGTTGINVKQGQTIDGAGYTLDIKGAGGTWDSGINTTGGTIKNLTVTGSFRGIFINHNSDHSEAVILENVIITGTTYTISCDQGKNQTLTATNCEFYGWTSFAATLGEATFNNCTFGEGNGYAYCRPYAPTSFNNCEFEEEYQVDASRNDENSFTNCTVGGEPLTQESLTALLGGSAENATVKNTEFQYDGYFYEATTANENGIFETGVMFDIYNIPNNAEVKVELYSNDTLLMTKSKKITTGSTSCTFYTNSTSGSWTETPSPWVAWEELMPTRAVLYIDGVKCDVTGVDFTKEEWAAFNGVNAGAPVVEKDDPIIIEKEEEYKSIIASTENGSVSVDDKKVTRGEKVTITVTPNKGYELAALSVMDEEGNERKLTENEDGTFSFRMPEGGVTIEAEFAKIGASTSAPSTEKENPSTGASDFVGAAAALAMVSALGMAALSIKR